VSNGGRIACWIWPCHEEGTGVVQLEETAEVQVATVHDIERPRLRNQKVEGIHVVQFPDRDVDEGRDASALFRNLVHLTAGVLTQCNRVVLEFVAVTATDLFLSHGVSSS